MNPFKSIVACLLLLLAGGLAFVGGLKSPLHSGDQAIPSRSSSTTRSPESSNSRDSKTTIRVAPAALDLSVSSDDPAQQAACAKVEWTARRRLESLDELLKLTKIQQQRIFPILVLGSAGASPAMKAGGQYLGEARQSMEDAICAELDPTRQAIYQEMLMEDAAWWSAAATRLESSPDESAVQPTSLLSPVR